MSVLPTRHKLFEEGGKHQCFDGAKLGKITQVVNGTRQKYSLELDVDCDSKSKAKKKSAEGSDE